MNRTSATKHPEPRAHHYVPQCWLSGFTETGKDGRLWVTDLSRQKQWPATPENAGHIRDFYRLSDPSPDPVVIEKFFSAIEGQIAPLLKSLDAERRAPNDDELDALLHFMALQWVRTPRFRTFALQVFNSSTRRSILEFLRSPQTWRTALLEAGIDPDTPKADYESAQTFVTSGEYNLVAGPDWYLLKAIRGVERIMPSLRNRFWETSFSEKGRFIASDNPVGADGPRGEKVGFKNADVVFYPISRHVLLTGTSQRLKQLKITFRSIAQVNTMMLLNAEAQVYSPIPDFCWADEQRRVQTDWRLFSKNKF